MRSHRKPQPHLHAGAVVLHGGINKIAYVGNPLQAAMARFLEASVAQFSTQQRQFLQQLSGRAAEGDLGGLVKSNLDAWLGMQESFLNMLASVTPPGERRDKR
jgi:polyhydroxyalkanoate synthesis regulator protein